MAYQHSIGTTYESMEYLYALATPIPNPRGTYKPYSVVRTAVNGEQVGIGDPEATWTWTVLTMAQIDQLREYVTDLTATVYIRILLNDGTYADFSALAHWPPEEQRSSRFNFNFTMRFTHLTPAGN